MENITEEHTFPENAGFGSFTKIMVQTMDDDFVIPGNRRKVTIQHQSLPDANGYWNDKGREHKVFYKKKLIAILYTEDCGMGNTKAHAFLRQRGFIIG